MKCKCGKKVKNVVLKSRYCTKCIRKKLGIKK